MTSDVRAIVEPAEPLKWEPGTYALSELTIMRPYDSSAAKAGRQRFEILAKAYPQLPGFDPGSTGVSELLEEPPTDNQMRGQRAFSPGRTGPDEGVAVPEKSWSKIATGFTASSTRTNEWTITLPEEMIKAVREKLRGGGSRKPQ
jgi:hypothetical protein